MDEFKIIFAYIQSKKVEVEHYESYKAFMNLNDAVWTDTIEFDTVSQLFIFASELSEKGGYLVKFYNF